MDREKVLRSYKSSLLRQHTINEYLHVLPSGKSLMNYVALMWVGLGAGVFSSYRKSLE